MKTLIYWLLTIAAIIFALLALDAVIYSRDYGLGLFYSLIGVALIITSEVFKDVGQKT